MQKTKNILAKDAKSENWKAATEIYASCYLALYN